MLESVSSVTEYFRYTHSRQHSKKMHPPDKLKIFINTLKMSMPLRKIYIKIGTYPKERLKNHKNSFQNGTVCDL